MTTKTREFSPEVRERAVRMVLEHAGEYSTRSAAVEVDPASFRGATLL